MHNFLLIQLSEGLQSPQKGLDSSPYITWIHIHLLKNDFSFLFFGQGGSGGGVLGLSRFGSSGPVNTGFLRFFFYRRRGYIFELKCSDGPGLNFPQLSDPSGLYVRRDGLLGHYLVRRIHSFFLSSCILYFLWNCRTILNCGRLGTIYKLCSAFFQRDSHSIWVVFIVFEDFLLIFVHLIFPVKL